MFSLFLKDPSEDACSLNSSECNMFKCLFLLNPWFIYFTFCIILKMSYWSIFWSVAPAAVFAWFLHVIWGITIDNCIKKKFSWLHQFSLKKKKMLWDDSAICWFLFVSFEPIFGSTFYHIWFLACVSIVNNAYSQYANSPSVFLGIGVCLACQRRFLNNRVTPNSFFLEEKISCDCWTQWFLRFGEVCI